MNIRHVSLYRLDIRCWQQEIVLTENNMTTTTNIHMNSSAVNQNTNNMTEEGTMNHANNNINMVARISNAFRMGSMSQVIAAAAVGLALTISIGMSGTANADVPSVTNIGSYLGYELNDDFSLVYGTPDSLI
jgi:hypothetical protein